MTIITTMIIPIIVDVLFHRRHHHIILADITQVDITQVDITQVDIIQVTTNKNGTCEKHVPFSFSIKYKSLIANPSILVLLGQRFLDFHQFLPAVALRYNKVVISTPCHNLGFHALP